MQFQFLLIKTVLIRFLFDDIQQMCNENTRILHFTICCMLWAKSWIIVNSKSFKIETVKRTAKQHGSTVAAKDVDL